MCKNTEQPTKGQIEAQIKVDAFVTEMQKEGTFIDISTRLLLEIYTLFLKTREFKEKAEDVRERTKELENDSVGSA